MKILFTLPFFLLSFRLYAFDFGPDTPSWDAVNDSVMGGISRGGVSMMKDKGIRFAGILSLENNGGFSSIRSNSKEYSIPPGKDILLTVRGDGRSYFFDLRTHSRQRAFTYRQSFKTAAGEISEIRLPPAGFYATSFGRRLPMADSLDPEEVQSIGFTLSDKKAGPFRLDILNIQLVDAQSPEPKTVEDLLQMAVHFGVPLYNRGDADACAAVYETALSSLMLLSEEDLSKESRILIASTLQAGTLAVNSDDRAWALRKGIDQLMKRMEK